MTVNPMVDGGAPRPSSGRRGIAGAVVALVLGVLFALVGVGGIIGGAASAAVLSQEGSEGYLNSPVREFSAPSYALTTPPARVGVDQLPFDLGSLRIAAESTAPGGEIFIGIGAKSDVDRYLSGVHTTEITRVEALPFRVGYRDVPGQTVPSPPSGQTFWAVSSSGPGIQHVTMDLRSGDWVLVIMNADAGAGVTAEVQAAVRSTLFGALGPGLWIGGIVILVIGAGLITLGAILIGRRSSAHGSGGINHPNHSGYTDHTIQSVHAPQSAPSAQPLQSAEPATGKNYPARLSGHLDPDVSRGLWLVKWLLAIPHFIILFFLWIAVVITTIISGFAILFTGRYPRPLFDFAVGVLRWNWRVTFYAYSALATDKYPPFTLDSSDYPADFNVDYPDRLSHGLVLVKGWLLAIPHLMIVAVFTGAAWSSWDSTENWSSDYGRNAGLSLLGLLVLIAAVILLFTGRYQRPLFNLIMGINRWIYRVATYTLLLRDEYPPFRLDQGPDDPAAAKTPAVTTSLPPDAAPEPPQD
ncbi:DUF4389 domain-containing protein [Arthrobacter sp. E3]|uniref:DUF4389 domain-containing protein n=1 Tax=Arthrobacter sp. E3 TaxID=517402 RepID=UPI001FFDC1ED|nr:DUF4389 domain-containing protein [Arthrobacter sp. E3]